MKATSWVELFNALFAVGLSMLYFSNVKMPDDGYVPMLWDYMYFLWEKLILLLFFICLLKYVRVQRVRKQLWVLGGFSFIRFTWQIIEMINHTFNQAKVPLFILALLSLGIVFYLTGYHLFKRYLIPKKAA